MDVCEVIVARVSLVFVLCPFVCVCVCGNASRRHDQSSAANLTQPMEHKRSLVEMSVGRSGDTARGTHAQERTCTHPVPADRFYFSNAIRLALGTAQIRSVSLQPSSNGLNIGYIKTKL